MNLGFHKYHITGCDGGPSTSHQSSFVAAGINTNAKSKINFNELSKSIDFDNITDGRLGAILVEKEKGEQGLIPIVRSTTAYTKPAHSFTSSHYELMEEINRVCSSDSVTKFKTDTLKFNNAMIEIYDDRYRTMGYHSDQSQDLANNSYICLFSCYDDPSSLRKLKVQDKITKEITDIILDDCSIVIFSLETNQKSLHKILLDTIPTGNRWLGITFRMSKTFIYFNNELPYFYGTDQEFTLADDAQKKLFYKIRGAQNSERQGEYSYPDMSFTISRSDLACIKSSI